MVSLLVSSYGGQVVPTCELSILGIVLSDSKMELAMLAGARSLVYYFMKLA